MLTCTVHVPTFLCSHPLSATGQEGGKFYCNVSVRASSATFLAEKGDSLGTLSALHAGRTSAKRALGYLGNVPLHPAEVQPGSCAVKLGILAMAGVVHGVIL